MQGKNETFRNFSERTDALAVRLDTDLGGVMERLGMGRASFFGYRTGKRPISGKAWAKLEAAERAAGIGVRETAPPGIGPGAEPGDTEEADGPERRGPPTPEQTAAMLDRISRVEETLGDLADLTRAIADALGVEHRKKES